MIVDADSGELLGGVAEVHGARGTAIASQTGRDSELQAKTNRS
jgi:hypothetical protein